MSSLSATQADGYYIPPEHFLSGQYKKKTRNQLAESSSGNRKGHTHAHAHARLLTLRNTKESTRRQGVVVRFELPYPGFCEHCGCHVGTGTRFNATKHTTGTSYYTTPIFEFRMKCRICSAMEFRIRTNPKEQGFDFISGLYKQKHSFHHDDSNTTYTAHAHAHATTNTNTNTAIESSSTSTTTSATTTTPSSSSSSSSSKLHSTLAATAAAAADSKPAVTEHDALCVLMSDTRYAHDVSHNAMLRTKFRTDRREKKRARWDTAGPAMGWSTTDMAVLPVVPSKQEEVLQDFISAKSITFSNSTNTERNKFRTLRTSSIFTPSSTTTTTTTTTTIAKNKKEKKRWSRESSTDVGVVEAVPVPDQVVSQQQQQQQPMLTTTINTEPMSSTSSCSNNKNDSSSSSTLPKPKCMVKQKKTLVLTTPGKVAVVTTTPPVMTTTTTASKTTTTATTPSSLDVLAAYYDDDDDDDDSSNSSND